MKARSIPVDLLPKPSGTREFLNKIIMKRRMPLSEIPMEYKLQNKFGVVPKQSNPIIPLGEE